MSGTSRLFREQQYRTLRHGLADEIDRRVAAEARIAKLEARLAAYENLRAAAGEYLYGNGIRGDLLAALLALDRLDQEKLFGMPVQVDESTKPGTAEIRQDGEPVGRITNIDRLDQEGKP